MNEQWVVYQVERGGGFHAVAPLFVEEVVFRRGHLIYSRTQHIAARGLRKTTLSSG